MARMVRVTIEYDMDDPKKPIADELWDWLQGAVTVQDIVSISGEQAVSIREFLSDNADRLSRKGE